MTPLTLVEIFLKSINLTKPCYVRFLISFGTFSEGGSETFSKGEVFSRNLTYSSSHEEGVAFYANRPADQGSRKN